MSDGVRKLVERLRSKYCCDTPNCNCDEAADEIDRLTAENERLKDANAQLQEIVNGDTAEEERLYARVRELEAGLSGIIDAWDWWQVDTYDRCASVPSDAIDSARALLTPISNGQTGGK